MKAFAPHNLADFSDIEITPELFSVKICQVAGHSQQFQLRNGDFYKTHPKHPAFGTDNDARNDFSRDLMMCKVTPDTLAFLCNVVIVDWTLLDDDGKKVPFDPDSALELFNSEPGAKKVAHMLLQGCNQDDQFKVEDLKN